MESPRLYEDLAWLWPVLSPPAHYVSEAATLEAVLDERLGPGPKRVLELGAGGGHTLVHLLAIGAERSLAYGGWGGEHTGVAVDLSEAMLSRCRTLIPGIDARVGDMRDVRLNETFDAVLIHDAVDYLVSEDDVRQTFTTVREHLHPGGLALIAPTYVAETFEAGDCAEDVPEPDAFAGAVLAEHGVECVSYASRLGDVLDDGTFAMTLTYRITHADGRVETVEDRHGCGLFSEKAWLTWMQEAGLPAERVDQGAAGDGGAWTLFVGRAGK
ncbi:MAG: class I SAM-dependent methyltransferase [Planctomycetota bacterium]